MNETLASPVRDMSGKRRRQLRDLFMQNISSFGIRNLLAVASRFLAVRVRHIQSKSDLGQMLYVIGSSSLNNLA
jgi:hypothetical protein